MVRGKYVNLGVWEGDRFVGAVVFSLGSGKTTRGDRFGLNRYFEVAELQRVALRGHRTQVSRILRISVAMLRKQSRWPSPSPSGKTPAHEA